MLRAATRLIREVGAVATVADMGTSLAFAAAVAVRLPSIVHARTLVSADERMSHRGVTVRAGSRDVVIPGEAFGGIREIFARRVYTDFPGFDLHPGTVVVDLGANRGLFSLLAAAHGCTVLAVEAQKGFVDGLADLMTRNNCNAMVRVTCARVGSGGVLNDPARLATATHLNGVPPVDMSLGHLIDMHHFGEIDFLKCDIEGSEFGLFLADDAPRWLGRVKRIAMEVHRDYGDPATLARALDAHGYRVSLVTNDRRVVRDIRDRSGYLFASRHN